MRQMEKRWKHRNIGGRLFTHREDAPHNIQRGDREEGGRVE